MHHPKGGLIDVDRGGFQQLRCGLMLLRLECLIKAKHKFEQAGFGNDGTHHGFDQFLDTVKRHHLTDQQVHHKRL